MKMNTIEFNKTAAVGDFSTWSLLKNILDFFPEFDYYIKTNKETEDFLVDVNLSLNMHVLKTAPDLLDILDLERLLNYLVDTQEQHIQTLTVTPDQ